MEAGLYEHNDELLESIAKATFAATGVPSLPLRRRTIEPAESSSLGSTSSSASTEVPVGSLSRNTSTNQVRLIIPRTTPAATIAALTQMLWDDVFRHSKRASTAYRGREDYTVSQKKVQSATLMLRAAYVEFYRGLGLLKSYRLANSHVYSWRLFVKHFLTQLLYPTFFVSGSCCIYHLHAVTSDFWSCLAQSYIFNAIFRHSKLNSLDLLELWQFIERACIRQNHEEIW